MLTRVGVDVSKFFGVRAGAGLLKRGARAESESEKCDSAHLWSVRCSGVQDPDCGLQSGIKPNF